jgi:hypothetical protein
MSSGHFTHSRISDRPISHEEDYKFHIGSKKLPHKYELKTNLVGLVHEDPCLKQLYDYHHLERKYSPDPQKHLTFDEFKRRISHLDYLINIITKIHSFSDSLESIPDHHKAKELQACREAFKRQDGGTLSVLLIDRNMLSINGKKIAFEPINGQMADKWSQVLDREEPMFICNRDTACAVLSEKILAYFRKTMEEHEKYFNELVKEGKFEDCLDAKSVKKMEVLLVDTLKKLPGGREKVYAELSEEIRQNMLAVQLV